MSDSGLRLGIRRSLAASRLGSTRASTIRRPIAAGDLYPADPDELRSTVTALLDGVSVPAVERLARAYVAPHSAMDVTGALSARVYARIRAHADAIRRVVILGPMHDGIPDGCFISPASVWESPLGTMEVDAGVTQMLERDGHIRMDADLHARQSSIEVQLPMLQVAAPRARIVPVLVGAAGTDDVVVTLSAIFAYAEMQADGETVVIATAELTGGGRDTRTMEAFFDLAASRIAIRDVCGAYTLRGLLGWAAHSDLRPELLGADAGNIACALHDWLLDDD
jgi:AmmeMemoRadiSam system protein B